MLLELVDRRMVVNISECFDRYTRSRLDPASFLVTPEELQSYVHLPAGETAASLRSLEGGTSTRAFTLASIAGEKTIPRSGDDISSRLVRLARVPKNEKILEDSSVQPLSHLAASTVRTFELVYSGGKTDILLSAETVEDMRKYTGLLSLVYGGLKFEMAEPQPAFMMELPVVTGLLSADLRKGAARSQHQNSRQSNRPRSIVQAQLPGDSSPATA